MARWMVGRPVHPLVHLEPMTGNTDSRAPWRPRARTATSPAVRAFADEVASELGQHGEQPWTSLPSGVAVSIVS